MSWAFFCQVYMQSPSFRFRSSALHDKLPSLFSPLSFTNSSPARSSTVLTSQPATPRVSYGGHGSTSTIPPLSLYLLPQFPSLRLVSSLSLSLSLSILYKHHRPLTRADSTIAAPFSLRHHARNYPLLPIITTARQSDLPLRSSYLRNLQFFQPLEPRVPSRPAPYSPTTICSSVLLPEHPASPPHPPHPSPNTITVERCPSQPHHSLFILPALTPLIRRSNPTKSATMNLLSLSVDHRCHPVAAAQPDSAHPDLPLFSVPPRTLFLPLVTASLFSRLPHLPSFRRRLHHHSPASTSATVAEPPTRLSSSSLHFFPFRHSPILPSLSSSLSVHG